MELKNINRICRVHYTSYEASELISNEIESLILEQEKEGKNEVVFVCIGTDRSTGDSLGPLIGTKLRGFEKDGFYAYGDLENPVHAQNLDQTMNEIKEKFTNPIIIAIDACLGKVDSIGVICVGRGSLKPGSALNKNLQSVGDIYITGIVNVGGFMDLMVLQGTRLSFVLKMSEKIAYSIRRSIRKIIEKRISI